jgi:hypothetical protein
MCLKGVDQVLIASEHGIGTVSAESKAVENDAGIGIMMRSAIVLLLVWLLALALSGMAWSG